MCADAEGRSGPKHRRSVQHYQLQKQRNKRPASKAPPAVRGEQGQSHTRSCNPNLHLSRWKCLTLHALHTMQHICLLHGAYGYHSSIPPKPSFSLHHAIEHRGCILPWYGIGAPLPPTALVTNQDQGHIRHCLHCNLGCPQALKEQVRQYKSRLVNSEESLRSSEAMVLQLELTNARMGAAYKVRRSARPCKHKPCTQLPCKLPPHT